MTDRLEPIRRFGGSVALALVGLFWVVAVIVNRLSRGLVASPILDLIFLAYLIGAPLIAIITVVLHEQARRAGTRSGRVQALVAIGAFAAWIVGLPFLDLR